MKGVIVILSAVAILAGIYFLFIADSGAVKVYKQFATACAKGDREQALQFAESEDVLGGDVKDNKRFIGGVPAEALHGISIKIESETKNDDGSVSIQAIQQIYFDPPGATSAIGGAMTSIFRQTADLTKTASGWKITAFENELVETKETRE
jgi:hypothetical protein